MNIGGNCKKIYNNFMLHFVSIGLKYYVVHKTNLTWLDRFLSINQEME
jgi:hypothetical protein